MAEIHLFSGLGSSIIRPFQRGTRTLEGLIDGLPSAVDAKHHIWSSWNRIADQLIVKHKAGELTGPVVLIGHSNGVLAICNIAARLASHGIEVAYLGAIDPTAARFVTVGHNVKQVDEFWATSGYPKLKRWMTKNKRAACQFVPAWNGEHNLWTLKATHVGIGTHTYVQDRIFDQVKKKLA